MRGFLSELVNAMFFGMVVTFGVTVIGLAVPTSRPLLEWLIKPGYVLPKWYWGGVHDPLQVLLVICLNVALYAVVYSVLRGTWTVLRRTVSTKH